MALRNHENKVLKEKIFNDLVQSCEKHLKAENKEIRNDILLAILLTLSLPPSLSLSLSLSEL